MGSLALKQCEAEWLQRLEGWVLTIHTGATSEENETFRPTTSQPYKNKYGERVCSPVTHSSPIGAVEFDCSCTSELMQIIFDRDPDSAPPSYVFVPSGNAYNARNCRRLTKEFGRSVTAIWVRISNASVRLSDD